MIGPTPQTPLLPPLAVLRDFLRPGESREHCELCSDAIAEAHAHLVELHSMQSSLPRLLCACDACAILFSTQQKQRYRRVPRRIEFLSDFRISDLQWNSLQIPIQLAFIMHSSAAGRPIALYPSPAGAVESSLDSGSWQDLLAENPMLGELESDVEALLANRVGQTREYYRAPIDECYRLVGLIRMHWKGLSGGSEVWKQINLFFTNLKRRSTTPKAVLHD